MNSNRCVRLYLVLGMLSLPLANQRAVAQSSLPVPSTWQGQIEGQVSGQRFRLPVTVELSAPLPQEGNALRLSISVEQVHAIGSIFLTSSLRTTTPYTGRQATLRFMDIRRRGNTMSAVLVDNQASTASVINQFAAPNRSSQHAPGGMAQIFGSLGPTELCHFRRGAQVQLQFDRGVVRGKIQGRGRGYINIFPSPDHVYSAALVARRVR